MGGEEEWGINSGGVGIPGQYLGCRNVVGVLFVPGLHSTSIMHTPPPLYHNIAILYLDVLTYTPSSAPLAYLKIPLRWTRSLFPDENFFVNSNHLASILKEKNYNWNMMKCALEYNNYNGTFIWYLWRHQIWLNFDWSSYLFIL